MFAKLYGGQGPLTSSRRSGRASISCVYFLSILLNFRAFDEMKYLGQHHRFRRPKPDAFVFYQAAKHFTQDGG